MAYKVHINQLVDVNDNPNAAGEYLRGLFFDQSDGKYGCYSTFNLNNGVLKLPDETIVISDEETDPYDWYDDNWTWTKAELNGIVMRYHWDGDGTLEFILPDGSMLSNDDCKKDYNWAYSPPR